MTGRRALRRTVRPRRDEGTSLLELLMAMMLFSVLITILGAATTLMFKNVRHQLGTSDDLAATRRVLALLDRQVRYANAVDTPGRTADGTWWVEWQSGNTGGQQSCTQWRLQPTGQLQVRSWQQPAPTNVGGPISGQTAWNTRASGILPPTTGQPFDFPPDAVQTNTFRQQLVVSFLSSAGRPVVTSPSQLTLTAQNTTSSRPLTTPVCGGQRVP